MADSSKTEKATSKKRQDERKKGNVFLSKDAVTVATLMASFMILWAMADDMVATLGDYFLFCMRYMNAADIGGVQGYLQEIVLQGIRVFFMTVGPIVAATVLACVAATFAQTKMLFAWESMKPKFSHISPLQGIKRLFSLRSLIEALKGIIKISILLYIIYNYITGLVGGLSNYMKTDISWACAHLFEQTTGMVLQISFAFIALAAFDFFYQWWDYERGMRMTKQEVKEEYKQMEGDPQIKGKIKEAQKKLAMSRMMQQVPKADVVIRNPDHFAVALRYKPETDAAPLVLAKGMDELALRIVKVAEENKIPAIENVALARALYASAELNREIPPELYGAVAEVLVYLYQIGGQKLDAGR